MIPSRRPCPGCHGTQVTIATKDAVGAQTGYQPLIYKGGPILGWPELCSLYWGAFSNQQMTTMQDWLAGYAAYLGGGGAPAGQTCVLQQYGIGGGTVSTHYNQTANVPSSASEGDAQNLLESLQSQNHLPGYAANRLFLIFTTGISFSGYGTQWCGYHGNWGTGKYFAIIPYPSVGGCGDGNADSSWQSVTSHEIGEAATDPGVGSGWVVGTEEGGDVCAWQEDQLGFGTIQKFADNMEAQCSSWTAKGLLSWSLAGNTLGFGNTSLDPTWVSHFTGSPSSELLFFSPGDFNWWLGRFSGASLGWTLAGNTKGFGNTQHDPTWIGSFTGLGKDEVLFYSSGDQNWWLGTFNGTSLSWNLAGNTHGFGNTGGYPTWINDFTGSGKAEVLFYSPGDQNWWLGIFNGTSLSWNLAGNTHGFGNTSGDPTWTGDFTGSGRAEVLFYSPGDQNWWLGAFNGTSLTWSLAGNTHGFGNTVGDPTWVGDFSGVQRLQVLFYSPGDQNWWLGTFNGTSLGWGLAGNTKGFGNTQHDPTWIGDFTASGRSEVLFYYSGDSHWWLGEDNAGTLQWPFAGNTRVFGANIHDGRPWFVGPFTKTDRDQMLFYYPGDGNWWLGST